MSELGSAALTNIENIVRFLKVEKMHELVFESEQPTTWTEKTDNTGLVSINQETIQVRSPQAFSEKPRLLEQTSVQGMLDKLRADPDNVQVQFRPKTEKVVLDKVDKKSGKLQQIVKNEDYYLEHCPVELCSILLKTFVQELCQFEVVQSAEQIPHSISKLLYLANGKSDLTVEKEIFDCYLYETKKIIDDEVTHLTDKISTLISLKDKGASLQTIDAAASPSKLPADPAATTVDEQQQRLKHNVLSMKAFEGQEFNPVSAAEPQKTISEDEKQKSERPTEEVLQENQKIRNELSQLQLTMKEAKQRQKDV